MILEDGNLKIDTVHQGDCLELMPFIKDKSIDLILCDLPYGSTACHWDQIIPFEPLWKEYKRLIKDHGAIVLTASQPFTSALVMSNPGMFRYEWIWEKSKASNFQHARRMPLKSHENILTFYKKMPVYNYQKTPGEPYFRGGINKDNGKMETMNTIPNYFDHIRKSDDGSRFPRTVQYFRTSESEGRLHPTQKPVALFEYLIKTYTDEGDLVLDNCAGSGTTAIAALNCNRHYILIEKEPKYCEIARKRISAVPTRLSQWE